MYFPYGPSQQWLLVCHNKQPLPSIIYLPDPLSLQRYVWDIFHIQWRFGDGGGHQPVGLNAGIVYNSDPTSRISNFGLFWSFHFKDAPKVGVHREKFNIGNVAQIFFGDFYICWDYVISFSQHFPMRKFSPSPSTSPSPPFHPLFEIWLKIAN